MVDGNWRENKRYRIMKKNINLIFLLILSSPFCFSLVGKSNFSKQIIDLGLVVTDLNQSLKFYKEVIGFEEISGFKVKGSFPEKVGLTDGAPLDIHVLVLGKDENATKLKLMQVQSKKKARKIKQPFIHTVAGFSYVTIFVENVDLVWSNAGKLGVVAYAESPQVLPAGLPQEICLLMLKDPDGNFVEIVGPKTKSLR